MTSLAHHWKEKGIQQGMQIGRNEGKHERTMEVAKNMITAGSDIAFISKVTGLSIDEINTLQK